MRKLPQLHFWSCILFFVRIYRNGFRFLRPRVGGGGGARNASVKRVIGDEVQGTMERRILIGEGHIACTPSCLVCAQIFIERETSVYEAAHEMCYDNKAL